MNVRMLEWTGTCWETKNSETRYQLNLGRDLSTLVKDGFIDEDRLNTKQKECIHMYYTFLFSNHRLYSISCILSLFYKRDIKSNFRVFSFY